MVLLQRYFRKKIQDYTKEVIHGISRNPVDIEIDEAGGQTIRVDKRVREMFDLKTKLSLIEEATETS